MVFFLDIIPEIGRRRIDGGQRIHDDKFFENLETQKLIRDAYYDILNLNKPLIGFFRKEISLPSFRSKLKTMSAVDHVPVVVIDASQPQKTVQDIVNEITLRFLRFKKIHKRKRLQPKEFLSVLASPAPSLPNQIERVASQAAECLDINSS